MSNTPQNSSQQIDTLQKVVVELQTAIQSGDCTQMNAKIKDVLKEAQPVQNLIQVGKLQESDEKISNLKAEIRVATGEILQKCPKGKNATNSNKTKNTTVKTNTTNNVKTNINNVKTNTNNNVKTNTNNVNMNAENTKVTSNEPQNQSGGKRKTRKTRKSRRSRKM